MAIEGSAGKNEWRYRLNEYNQRQIMKQRTRVGSRWEKCGEAYATVEEAAVALRLLLHPVKGGEGDGGEAGGQG